MHIAVKICGLTSPEAVHACVENAADMVGFVFFTKSPRHCPLEKAVGLANLARQRTRIVSVMVDPNDDEVSTIVKSVKPDFIQLHGRETVARVAAIKSQSQTKVIKALGIATAEDLQQVETYRAVSDYLLLDAKPTDQDLPGGLGRAFDWRLLESIQHKEPLILSGGLTVENVAEALEISHLHAVDVSSGVEISAGIKDEGKIKSFIHRARGASF